jgi:hypothetical protein
MNNDYQILGIQPNASLKDIKLAYWKKASKIHPDVNPSPTAHEDFIALTEAYESALRGKTGRVYNESSRNYSKASSSYSEADLKEQARERARRAAQMEYQEFIHSDYYKSKMSQIKTVELWGSLILFISLFTMQLLLFSYLKTEYIISGIAIFLISGPILFNFIKLFRETNANQIFKDSKSIIKTDVFSTLVVLAINVFVFVNVGFVVFIPMKIMLMIYLIIPIVIQIFREIVKISENEKTGIKLPQFLVPFARKVGNLKRPFFSIWGAIPFAFSMILLLNSSFSFQSETVTQKYSIDTAEKDSRMIKFQDQEYNNYIGLCYFNENPEVMYLNNTITFKKKIGLLGIPFIDEYVFSNREGR